MKRIVVVSNRLPSVELAHRSGKPEIPAGGLASAVFGALLREPDNLWFGWNGKAGSDTDAPPLARHDIGPVHLAAMSLSRTEYERYYHGFSNGALWPLFHCFPERARIDPADEAGYKHVQVRFAQELRPLLRPDDRVWVHDYHLLLFGRELRELGWHGRTGFFLHIPFPPYDIFRALPDPRDYLQGLMQYDLVGFHVRGSVDNYAYACQRELGAKWDGRRLRACGREQRVGAFPIGIDPDAFRPSPGRRPTREGLLKHEVAGRQLILGVDRLDYTKGIPERMLAFGELIRGHSQWRKKVFYVQIAAPSRTRVPSYVEQKRTVDAIVGRVNGELGEPDWTPIRYLYRSYPRDHLARFYQDADVGLVTPLRDGMNLVAKEFVAAQPLETPGVLVLSRFAGAAELMPAAVMVNPHVSTDISRGLEIALRMPLEERKARHRELLQSVLAMTADDWARAFLDALEGERELELARPARASPTALRRPGSATRNR
ncbi:MAG TPA: trehalose-6-phosphate synthase [Planctomycetota bacterium]|nr:trehalose-6-phosphate synthase [Planctomycetota bacterium]